MRIGALLLVGLGFVFAAACTANTSADLVCNSGGGTCIALDDAGQIPDTCASEMTGLACDTGFICCTIAPPAGGGGSAPVEQAPDAHSGS